jgi:hypothetical protein
MRIARLFCTLGAAVMLLSPVTTTQAAVAGAQKTTTTTRQTFIALEEEGDTVSGDSYGKVTYNVKKNDGDFTVYIDYGIDGYAEYAEGSQVTVTVKSDSNFSGKVSVMPYYTDSYSGSRSVRYSKKVSLASGEENKVSFSVENLGSGNVKVEIYDSKDELVYQQDDTLTLQNSGNTAVVGVLSEDYSALNYFDNNVVTVSGTSVVTRTLDMTGDTFPEEVEALDSVDYMVVDNYDTSKLKDSQYGAIKDWVSEGGVLVLALGPDYSKTLNMLDSDLADIQTNGSRTVRKSFVGADGETYELKNLQWVDFELSEGTDIGGQQSLGEFTKYGDGKVLVLPYSLGLTPVSDSSCRQVLAETIMEGGITDWIEAIVDSSYYNATNLNDSYYAKNVASLSIDKERLHGGWIVIALILYTLLSGPITYIVLKKKKRRELVWAVVPAWALIGIGALFVLSLKYRVKTPVSGSLLTADIGGDTMKVDVFSDVITPKSGKYSLDVDNSYSNIDFSYDYYAYSATSPVVEQLYDGDNISLSYETDTAFQQVSFYAAKKVQNDIGSIELNLKNYTDGFEGTVTNNTNYDIDSFKLQSENFYYAIDTFPAGETITISRDDCNKMENNSYLANFEKYYTKRYGSYDNAPEYESYLDSYFSTFRYRYEVSGSNMSAFAYWGLIDRDVDLLTENKVENYGKYAIYSVEALPIEDVNGCYYDSIYKMDVNADSDEYDAYDLSMYAQEITMDVQFLQDDVIDTLMYEENSQNVQGQTVKVEAYNWQSDTYEQIFVNEDTISGKDLEKYMSSNMIRLRFTNSSDYMAYLPEISAKGGQ